jgi:hypothetical protein
MVSSVRECICACQAGCPRREFQVSALPQLSGAISHDLSGQDTFVILLLIVALVAAVTRLPSKESREFYRPARIEASTIPGVSSSSPVNKQRVQVLDELGAGGAQRQGPGAGVAVRVTGVVEDVAEGNPGGGHRRQDGREGAGCSCAAPRTPRGRRSSVCRQASR